MKQILFIFTLLSLSPLHAVADNPDHIPSPEFKRRWLNVVGCWENQAVHEYWCNAPVNGPNLKRSLIDIHMLVREAEATAAGHGLEPDLLCLEIGRAEAVYHELDFLISDIAAAPEVSKELKDLIQFKLNEKFSGDNDFYYWDEVTQYCSKQATGKYRNINFLVTKLKKTEGELFGGNGELYQEGINDGMKRVNEYLGMDMPFWKDLP